MLTKFNAGRWGEVAFHQWEHPLERVKEFLESLLDGWAKWIKPGNVCVDIGAHTGDTAVPMAVVMRGTGRVWAFEPNQHVFGVLALNAMLHPTICPIPLAIMPKAGQYTFHYSDPAFCNGGYAEGTAAGPQGCHHTIPLTVQGMPLCDILSRPDFIKIDAEGFDAEILESIVTRLPFDCRPTIMAECFPALTDAERLRLWQAVPSGYTITDFSGAVRLDQQFFLSHRECFDFVCVPHD